MRRSYRDGLMLTLTTLTVLCLAGRWTETLSAPPPRQPGQTHVPGQVIVKFKERATQADKVAIRSDLQGHTLKVFPRIGAELLSVEGLTVEEAVGRYKDHGKVEYIEPNYWVHAIQTSVLPNDPLFDELWGMRNTGQTGGVPDADIDADEAWSIGTGNSSVLVGVIDTGVDYNHPDLAENMWTNPGEIDGNGIDDDGNGFVDDYRGWDFRFGDNDPMDDYGHGTHCSGTIGAVGDNGVGVAGVCWSVKICPIKWLDSGGWGTLEGAISSIEYATLIGCNLTSNSWGGLPYSEAMIEAIQDAYDNDILFIAAAGNSSWDNDISPLYPCSYDLGNIVSVAATDHDDQLAGFSCYGVTSVDLGAPGVSILSTVPGGGYVPASGTSMACPHVAGVAALILSLYPGMPADQVKARLLSMTDPIIALAGRCVSGGRLNAFACVAEPDSIPPAAVTDLAAFDPASNSMRLSWTATGDDGLTGTASYYQVRYSTSPITEANFYDATRAGTEPDPGPLGTAEEMEVRGLDFDTSYYFAVKVYDEWGNGSALSNVAVETTLGPPDIAWTPTSFSEDLLTGGTSTQVLTLSNEAEGTLDFVIPGVELVFSPTAPAAHLELAKGETDPRSGDPVTEGSGGPDGSGYRWIDSDEPGGPIFNWIDVSGIGDPIPLSGDDVNAGPFEIGFTFPFYDGEFDQFRICSNGFISFTSSSQAYVNQPIPNSGAPENLIAPFWDDLVMPGTNAYMYGDGSSLTIQYDRVSHYGSGGPYTFQVVLYPSGVIVFQYLSMRSPTGSATIGIQNATRDDGLQIAFNTDYVHDGLAVRIASTPRWVEVSPTWGRIPAGDFADLDVTFDAVGLMGGDYEANIVIESNDPDEGTVLVPVALHVTGAPDIAISGELAHSTSTEIFVSDGASTLHSLTGSVPVGGPGVLTVEVAGDFGDPSEFATVTVEGTTLGSVGPMEWDCGTVSEDFPLSVSQLQAFLSDGVVEVTVQNSGNVGPICGDNRHTVLLEYHGPADALDFGQIFAGTADTIEVGVQNIGTDVLNVPSISTDNATFSVFPSSMTLGPRESRSLQVAFTPATPEVFTGTLSITSDDPDQPLVEISLAGEGVEPPVVSLSPEALSEELYVGGVSERDLTLSNLGGSDLEFEILVRQAADHVSAIEPPILPTGLAPEDTVSYAEPPSGYAPKVRRPTFELMNPADNHDVLIVQDLMPWESVANQRALEANGLTYEMIGSSGLAGADLNRYRMVMLVSDQPTSYHTNVTAHRSELEAYLRRGGVVEIHGCPLGWNGGDLSHVVWPGGMRVEVFISYYNVVVRPDHPLATGIPTTFNTASSGGHFVNLPPEAEVIILEEMNMPSLITYPFGSGRVVASTGPLEFGYDRGLVVGQILMNMITYGTGFENAAWLTVDPTTGVVGAGESTSLNAVFSAVGLVGGDYLADIVIDSNDPISPVVTAPAALRVIDAPDIDVIGESVSVSSTSIFSGSGARTYHELSTTVPAGGPGFICVEVAGDYGTGSEYATVTAEGKTLGTVGPAGSDCRSAEVEFPLSRADLEDLLADGVVEVEVANSAGVDDFCADNHHTVTLRYNGPADVVDFGEVYVGFSDTVEVSVRNSGTEPLNVTSIAIDDPQFESTASSLSIDPGESEPLALVLTPGAEGPVAGTATILSNDPDEPETEIAVMGVGVMPPECDVDPDSITAAMYPGKPWSRKLSLCNTGGSELRFSVECTALAPQMSTDCVQAPLAIADPDGGKGAPEPSGEPQTFSAGGPDAFGHVWIDSDDPNGPVFDWVEVTGVGTLINMSGDDNNSGPWPVGFEFPFYGNTFTHFRICTNGFISFTSNSIQYTNVPLPNLSAPENLIAAWWDDLYFPGDQAYYYNDGSRLIIEFLNVPRLGETGPNTFEVILYPDGNIVLQYLSMRGWLESATVGIQDGGASDGLQVVYNAGYMHDNLAIEIGSPPDWLDLTPVEGTVAPGDCMDLEVAMDPSGMDLGEYEGWITVASNDPYNPLVTVPVRMIVAEPIEAASVNMDPNTLNLGSSGRWATCYIELPLEHDASEILVETVHPDLDTGDGPILPERSSVGDNDRDGVDELMVKFSRTDFEAALAEGDSVPVTVMGEIAGTCWFYGTDVIRVIRPHMSNVAGTLHAGDRLELEWTQPEGYNVETYVIHFSADAGETWSRVAEGVEGTSFVWTVPEVQSSECLLRLFACDNKGVMGYDTTDGFFTVAKRTSGPTGPALERFALFQNSPNPATGATAISFNIPKEAYVTLRIFNARGALVRTLIEEAMKPGQHRAVWDGKDDSGRPVSAGVYFYRFETGEYEASRKIVLLR